MNVYENEVTESFSELHQQLTTLERRMEEMVQEKDEALKKLQSALESSSQMPFNHGRRYDEVADWQRKRKIHTIKTAADQALCFIGLSVEKVILKSNNNEVVELFFSLIFLYR